MVAGKSTRVLIESQNANECCNILSTCNCVLYTHNLLDRADKRGWVGAKGEGGVRHTSLVGYSPPDTYRSDAALALASPYSAMRARSSAVRTMYALPLMLTSGIRPSLTNVS